MSRLASRFVLFIAYPQPELEHRTSKTRYARTGGKLVPLQLSRIEQRERRIRTIRQNISTTPSQIDPEITGDNPARQYNMGQTENFPIHMPTFLHKYADDPAVKVALLSSFALGFICSVQI